MRSLKRFLADESAATAVEYAVMLALIILVAIAGIMSVGDATGNMYDHTNSEMKTHGF